MNGRRAVFLDRDGTITVERGYVVDPKDLQLIPGAAEGISVLNAAGLLVVVVSNQSGVARGLMSEGDLARVHRALEDLLGQQGARVDGAYYCPNYLGGSVERYTKDASCRKPSTGMLEQAARDLDIDLRSCYMVGDQATDIETANRAGIPGVLVMTGKGRDEARQAEQRGLKVAHSASDLLEAVRWILGRFEGGDDGDPDVT